MGIVLRDTIRNNVMNVKRAPVLLGCFPAMLTHFVAFPDLLSALHPEGEIFKVARKFSGVFTEIVVYIFASVPFNLALWGAKASSALLAGLTTQLASWKRFTGRVNEAFAATVDRSIVPEFRFEQFATGWTRFGGWFTNGFPITFPRAILGLAVPLFHGCAGLLNDSLFANGAWFGFSHNDNYTMTRKALQGDT